MKHKKIARWFKRYKSLGSTALKDGNNSSRNAYVNSFKKTA